jgi:hypothetical protein
MSKNQKKENVWPLFVMGTQRSGTTLLTRILSAHKDMFVQNEAELPSIFDGEKSPTILIDKIKAEFVRHDNINIDEFIQNGCKVWGLKDPQLTEHINVLTNFLPHSKFIIILRDGRGVTNSYMENKWGLGTNAYTGAVRWKSEVKQQLAFMRTMPENFFFIKFEDMLQDLESSMKSACEFLNVEFDAEMLNYNKKESYYEIKKENIHTFKKPDMLLTKKWQQKLSTHEIDVIESVAGDLLEDFGYIKVGKPIELGRLQKAYYRIHQAIIGELQLQYKWRRFRVKDAIRNFRER